MPELSVTV